MSPGSRCIQLAARVARKAHCVIAARLGAHLRRERGEVRRQGGFFTRAALPDLVALVANLAALVLLGAGPAAQTGVEQGISN